LRVDPIDLAVGNWRRAGWDRAAPGMAAVTSVMRAQQLLLGRADDALRPFGLTFARYEVLMLLSFSRHGELPAGKIGERLQVHAASVTNALKRLEADGFVARKPNPRDGRGVLASITTAGREIAEKGSEVLNRDVFEALPLSDRDLRELQSVLRRLRRHFGDFG
jgi:DNA-binding MarR family transcriptional regulator